MATVVVTPSFLSATSPITVSGVTGISVLVPDALDTAGAITVLPSVDPGSSIVALTGEGQLLSAASILQRRFEVLQTVSDAGTAGVVETTQNLLSAINDDLQASVGTLTEIGVVLQIPSPAAATVASIVLRIDQDVLDAALSAEPAVVGALLQQTSQVLLDQAAAIEAQAAEAAVAIETLRQAPVAGLLAQTPLTEPDFSVAGVAETDNQVPTTAPVPTPVIAVTVEVPVTVPETPATPVATPIPATIATTATTTGTLAEANAADSEAFAAALALRDFLADPARHAARNLFDPAYAALIAASHMRDFVMTGQEGIPGAAPVDFPAPVSPVARLRAVASYLEASTSEVRLRERAVA